MEGQCDFEGCSGPRVLCGFSQGRKLAVCGEHCYVVDVTLPITAYAFIQSEADVSLYTERRRLRDEYLKHLLEEEKTLKELMSLSSLVEQLSDRKAGFVKAIELRQEHINNIRTNVQKLTENPGFELKREDFPPYRHEISIPDTQKALGNLNTAIKKLTDIQGLDGRHDETEQEDSADEIEGSQVDMLLRKGAEAIKNSDTRTARKCFKQHLLQCESRQRNTDPLLSLFFDRDIREQLARYEQSSSTSELQKRVLNAENMFQKGLWREVENICREVLDNHPEIRENNSELCLQLVYYLTNSLYQRREYRTGRGIAETWLPKFTVRSLLIHIINSDRIRTKIQENGDQQEDRIEDLYKDDTKYPYISVLSRLWLAVISEKTGNYKKAADEYAETSHTFTNRFPKTFHAAFCLSSLASLTIKNIKNARQRKKEEGTQIARRSWDSAMEIFRSACPQPSEEYADCLLLSRSFYGVQEQTRKTCVDNARIIYSGLRTQSENHAECLIESSDLYKQAQQIDPAIQFLQAACSILTSISSPTSKDLRAKCHFKCAKLLKNTEKPQETIKEEFKSACSTSKENSVELADYLTSFGNFLINISEKNEAIEKLERAKAIYREQGKIKKEEKCANKIAKLRANPY